MTALAPEADSRAFSDNFRWQSQWAGVEVRGTP